MPRAGGKKNVLGRRSSEAKGPTKVKMPLTVF